MSIENSSVESTQTNYFDVLIIGAGLSGVGAACHLSKDCPDHSFAVLEGRSRVGGTWDLFRYPGIRSDSDMFTFGYKFRPWTEPKVLADGGSIRSYIADTAAEYGIDNKIQFDTTTQKASWNSDTARWTLTASQNGEAIHYECKFLLLCTGYYKYAAGYTPDFPGKDNFTGKFIHPQHWPEDLDYSNKNVIVIGSGATAVTLVPAMSEKAAKVTMLQRTPTYVMSVPAIDKISAWLMKWLPKSWVYKVARFRNIGVHRALYNLSKKYPAKMRKFFLGNSRKRLDDPTQWKHFTPDYAPWDQRLCAVPNGDLFEAINSGKAEVVTAQIKNFTANGIELTTGDEIAADIIVSATGLDMQLLGGIEMEVDGKHQAASEVMAYKGTMIENAPNFAAIFGYTNAPWTLKADIASRYVCRLLNHMQQQGYDAVIPQDSGDNAIATESVMDSLNSGYVKRASAGLPRQGKELPWRVLNDYPRDKKMLLSDKIEDGHLQFSKLSDRPARRDQSIAA